VKRLVVNAIRAPFATRGWAEFGYALVGLPLAVAGFLFTVCSVVAGVLLLGSFIGLPLIALGLIAARSLGSAHRELAHRLLGWQIDAPPPAASSGRGLFGWLGANLRDNRGWRAYGYLLLKLPVAVVAFAAAVAFRVGGIIFLLTPLFQNPDDARRAADHDGYVNHPFVQYGHFQFDSWPKIALLVLQGATMIVLAPWVLRPVLLLDRWLMRWLLGPSSLSERVLELEHSRAAAMDDAAARLRRIERDLHDGAQAQLVAVAMKLNLAGEKLAADSEQLDVPRIRELVGTAFDTAQQAITELRDLVAGIHPPILNDGLPAALATLAARGAVPTQLRVDLPTRPSAAIESILYFCAAELLTNVAKHAGARHAAVELTNSRGVIRLAVSDDGVGGAGTHTGSGLSGLAERVRTVDGSLSVLSPPGGPTTINVRLPMHA
jgi:signal transduction histidine kinase